MTRPVRPNVGIEIAYRNKLLALIDAMNRSVTYWVTAVYRANEPKAMALDAERPLLEARYAGGALPWQAFVNGVPLETKTGKTRWFKTEKAAMAAARLFVGERLPAAELAEAMKDLGDKWLAQFDAAAPKLAAYFATAAADRSTTALRRILRDGGFSVKFQMTPATADILESTIAANVSLIKSIPEQYLTQVEGLVMRSVQAGRDLASLTKGLQEQFGVTRRRAAHIALDQNNKATSAIRKARELEVGIDEGIWMHSGAGKHPRPKHVAADGTRFKLSQGLKIGDKGQWVMPGEEIYCRCVWRAVIPGLSV